MAEFKSWKQPIQLTHTIKHSKTGEERSYSYRAPANQLKPHLYGIKETAKWPAEGLPKVMFKGIVFWVNPLGEKEYYDWYGRTIMRRKGPQSRLRCLCPECDKEVSYGRLHQHLRVHHEKL